jgi:uncharacterized protein (DUF4415 family)
MAKTVRYTLPKAPAISPEERKRLLALSEANEEDIDFSDIPASTDDTWRNAVRGRFYRPTKQQVTLRLDSNTLDWFRRHTPKGYQTDINRVLADYVAEQEKKAG